MIIVWKMTRPREDRSTSFRKLVKPIQLLPLATAWWLLSQSRIQPLAVVSSFTLSHHATHFSCRIHGEDASQQHRQLTKMNLFWFGGNDSKESDKTSTNNNNQSNDSKHQSSQSPSSSSSGTNTSSKSKSSSPSGMGATASMMENFKQSQELGKKTATLLADLSSSTVEGTAANGKVRVYFDGQQHPMGVEMDPEYLQRLLRVGEGGSESSGGFEDLNEAVTVAMQDAHAKSVALMDEKMRDLYSDLGLPPSSVNKS